jgi:ribA/ribD-fused uncharacterized protein
MKNNEYVAIWQNYAIHDDDNVQGFFGDYSFLSNFHICEVWYDGNRYASAENAYQAAKIVSGHRFEFTYCTPGESKRAWKKLAQTPSVLMDKTAEEWNFRKYDVMSAVVFDKFYRNLELRKLLLDTGDRYLEETNHWHDVTWGVDYKTRKGKNWLGLILAGIRTYWKNKQLRLKKESV